MWRAMGMAPPIKQSGVNRSGNQRDRLNVSWRMLADLVAGLLNEARVESRSRHHRERLRFKLSGHART